MNVEGGRQKKGKTYENNSCTPSNPKKYSSPGLKKKNHRREMLTTKIMKLENSPPPPPPPPHNFNFIS